MATIVHSLYRQKAPVTFQLLAENLRTGKQCGNHGHKNNVVYGRGAFKYIGIEKYPSSLPGKRLFVQVEFMEEVFSCFPPAFSSGRYFPAGWPPGQRAGI